MRLRRVKEQARLLARLQQRAEDALSGDDGVATPEEGDEGGSMGGLGALSERMAALQQLVVQQSQRMARLEGKLDQVLDAREMQVLPIGDA